MKREIEIRDRILKLTTLINNTIGGIWLTSLFLEFLGFTLPFLIYIFGLSRYLPDIPDISYNENLLIVFALPIFCVLSSIICIIFNTISNIIIKKGNYTFYYKDGSTALTSIWLPAWLTLPRSDTDIRTEFIYYWKPDRVLPNHNAMLCMTPYDVDGNIHGEQIISYDNGETAMQNNFVHGIANGVHKAYEKNGSLRWEINYTNGKPNKDERKMFLPFPYIESIRYRKHYLDTFIHLFN
jgi:hypothetical protein